MFFLKNYEILVAKGYRYFIFIDSYKINILIILFGFLTNILNLSGYLPY